MKFTPVSLCLLFFVLFLSTGEFARAIKAPAVYEDFAAVHFAYGNYTESEMLPEADADRDGVSNFTEFLFGTDPTQPDREKSQTAFEASSQNLTVSMQTRLGRKYAFQTSDNLASDWSDFWSFNGRDNSTNSIFRELSNRQFFRIKVEVIPPLYVDIDSQALSPDGLSWETAFQNLQDAINAAELGQEIWIAEGVYHPTEIDPLSVNAGSTDPRSRSFFLKEGIAIVGGFAGVETSISQRPGNLTTTLSGDFNGDDVWSETGTLTEEDKTKFFENAYHVVTAIDLSAPVLFLSVEITGGFAMELSDIDGNLTVVPGSQQNYGAGMVVVGSQIELADCILRRNISAEGGGAIFASGQLLTVGDQTIGGNFTRISLVEGFGTTEFLDNHVAEYSDTGIPFGDGGAVLLLDNTLADFRGAVFSDNSAPNGGAVGLRYTGSDRGPPGAVFVNCGFWSNRALAGPESLDPENSPWPTNGSGGAIFASNSAWIEMVSCYLGFNQALTNGYFGPNSTEGGWGGAVALFDGASAWVALSIFDNNFADAGGGAVYIAEYVNESTASLELNLSTFYANTSAWAPAIANEQAVVFGSGNIFHSNLDSEGNAIDLVYTQGESGPEQPFDISSSLFSGNNSESGNIGLANQSIDPSVALFTNPMLPEGEDGVWSTEDDGFTIAPVLRTSDRKIVTRPLPFDFPDFDADGDHDEELPVDSFGNSFGEGPFFYGAYPELFVPIDN